MAEPQRVVLLPGDGVGPEIVDSTVEVLERVAPDLELRTHAFGGAAIDELGAPLPETTLAACQQADAILLGAVGGPRWDGAAVRPEAGLLGLRKKLGLFANLRPVKPFPEVALGASPLKPEFLEGIDLVVVRELTGDIYFGEPRWRKVVDGEERAIDTADYRGHEVERIAKLAFELAQRRRGRVTSVDKANVLETSRLWRKIVTETQAAYPDVELNHQLVDSAAMRLITHASTFDVILAGNLFGDILSDEAAVLSGAIGMLPSASLSTGGRGLYEPIHGSAPDIAGQGIANPIGTILSAAMMLELSLNRTSGARLIEEAVEGALRAGARTRDLGGELSTQDMTSAIIDHLSDSNDPKERS